jgi:DNA-binding transcriptional MerR regulator
MLKPLKRSGGRRYYRPADVELVETIDRLVNREGYTLKGAKSAIREGKVKRAPSLAEQSSSSISVSVSGDHAAPDWLPQLKAIRSKLAAALEA